MNFPAEHSFLGAGAGTACLFLGKASPSNRITVGVIGIGRQTVQINLPQFFSMPDVQVAAVCDVDAWRLANAKKQVEDAYARQSASGMFKGCTTYQDFRELLANPSLDAVFIGAPDHWHVQMSMEAIQAGKDVSCEKPLTRCIADGRKLSDLVTKHRRVFRTDSEFRSLENFHRAVTLVRNGRIGKLHTIRTAVPRDRCRLPAATGNARSPGTGLRTLAGACHACTLYREARPYPEVLRPSGLDAAPVLLRRYDHQLGRPPDRHHAVGQRYGPHRPYRS